MNKNYFVQFNGLILQLTHQFFVWEYLQNPKNSHAYNMRGHFWRPVMDALFDDFLLLLINILDPKRKRVLSVYTFLSNLQNDDKELTLLKEIKNEKYKDVLNQLTKWRGNYLAHKNVYFISNPKELGQKFPIKHKDVKKLIYLLIKIIQETNKIFNKQDITNYYEYYKGLKNRCIEQTQFVIDNGLDTPEYKKLINKNG